jgi:O-antigen chain-terminating methyltransferase
MTIGDSRPDVQARTHDELFHFAQPLEEVRRDHEYILPFFKGARSVLDVGCGRGVFLEMLRDAGIKPVGVDLFPESVERCRALGFSDVYQADAVTYLQEHHAAYDGVVCSHIIEHLPYPDAMAMVRAAHMGLTAGGHLAIVTPNPRDLHVITELFWLDPTHVRPYPLPLLDAMLRSAGFEIVYADRPVIRASQRSRRRRLMYSLLPAQYFGRPNTYIVGRKPLKG